ncbi:MAG: amino acid ABC transporter permease [Chloroflexota bacterium]|nr:amino acid ABC transporter permease [Chloroflexota bacterium]
MRWSVLTDNLDILLQGLLVTLQVSVLAWLLAVAIGVVVALLRVTRSRAARFLGTAYVEFVRNVPLLVLIFFLFFALPDIGITLSGFWAGVIGLGVYTGAFIGEVLRSGILGVPRGQLEAALSSGLTYLQAMRLVILPQAIRTTIPPLGNQTINLIKNSSLTAAVSVFDILGTANLIGSRTFAFTPVYIGAAMLYLVLTIPAAIGVNAVERRLRIGYR